MLVVITERIVEERQLVAEGAEVEVPAELRVDVVGAELQARGCRSEPREVVPELELASTRRLRRVWRGPGRGPGREDQDRIVRDFENLVLEILEVEGELVQLVGADVDIVCLPTKSYRVVVFVLPPLRSVSAGLVI